MLYYINIIYQFFLKKYMLCRELKLGFKGSSLTNFDGVYCEILYFEIFIGSMDIIWNINQNINT